MPFLQESKTKQEERLKVSKSEILNEEKEAIAPILTETAGHPLISEKDLEVRQEMIKQIVKIMLKLNAFNFTPEGD